MVDKQVVTAVEKTDVQFIVAVLKMFTDFEVGWKPREIQALSEQMLVLWFRQKNPAKFVRSMNEFFEKREELWLPPQQIGRVMARQLRK